MVIKPHSYRIVAGSVIWFLIPEKAAMRASVKNFPFFFWCSKILGDLIKRGILDAVQPIESSVESHAGQLSVFLFFLGMRAS
jgi:hypothetical protein